MNGFLPFLLIFMFSFFYVWKLVGEEFHLYHYVKINRAISEDTVRPNFTYKLLTLPVPPYP
jgi:hypothetical protein